MTNFRTTLGGAIGTLGTSLAGIGTITSIIKLTNEGWPNLFIIWMTIIGYVLVGIGKFFTALFAADAKDIQAQLAAHTQAIAQIKGDTAVVSKDVKNMQGLS